MHRRVAAVAVTGAVGLGALGVWAFPALAENGTATPSASASSSSGGSDTPEDRTTEDRTTDRTTAIKEALKGLVSNKTLTQAQADKVAETLASSDVAWGPWGHHRGGGPGGFGGFGGWMGDEGTKAAETVAKAVGVTVEELRTELRSGKTLADLAKANGKDVAAVEKTLSAYAKERVAAAVKDGKITQAMADQILNGIDARVKTMVEEGNSLRGFGMGWGGMRHFRDGDLDGDGGTKATPSPSTATTSA